MEIKNKKGGGAGKYGAGYYLKDGMFFQLDPGPRDKRNKQKGKKCPVLKQDKKSYGKKSDPAGMKADLPEQSDHSQKKDRDKIDQEDRAEHWRDP